jgi:hypothetical protein
MYFRSLGLLVPVVSALLLYCAIVAADEVSTGDYSVGDPVPLNEVDLRQITDQVLAQNPLLSSSPGIKYASAQRSVRSIEIANVIYLPHSESAGIKHAFQVGCSRQVPDKTWDCNEAEIRRYLALDTQDFEVRVTGSIGSDEAIALIESTRDVLQSDAMAGSAVPQTAILIFEYEDGYLVSWGTSDGYQELTMQAHLSTGGDPANAKDWQVNLYSADSAQQ